MSQVIKDNDDFQTALSLYFRNREKCNLKYGKIEEWDTSNVTDMSKALKNKYYFNKDISGWNVSNVTNMECMFYGCKNFNQDISKWNGIEMQNMLEGATLYTYDKPVTKW